MILSAAERERAVARELAQIAAFEAARQALMDKWRTRQLENAKITVLAPQQGRLAPYERKRVQGKARSASAKRSTLALRE